MKKHDIKLRLPPQKVVQEDYQDFEIPTAIHNPVVELQSLNFQPLQPLQFSDTQQPSNQFFEDSQQKELQNQNQMQIQNQIDTKNPQKQIVNDTKDKIPAKTKNETEFQTKNEQKSERKQFKVFRFTENKKSSRFLTISIANFVAKFEFAKNDSKEVFEGKILKLMEGRSAQNFLNYDAKKPGKAGKSMSVSLGGMVSVELDLEFEADGEYEEVMRVLKEAMK